MFIGLLDQNKIEFGRGRDKKKRKRRQGSPNKGAFIKKAAKRGLVTGAALGAGFAGLSALGSKDQLRNLAEAGAQRLQKQGMSPGRARVMAKGALGAGFVAPELVGNAALGAGLATGVAGLNMASRNKSSQERMNAEAARKNKKKKRR